MIKDVHDTEEMKNIVVKHVQSCSSVKDKDKRNMINILQHKHNCVSVMKTVYDLILKYEGCGVVNLRRH